MEREPPSQPPRNGAVALARGTLRDGLGALGNLALLAGSSKVGSKAIAGVLPDVLSSCGAMREATRGLLAELRPWSEAYAVTQSLEDFVLPRLDELEHELTERMGAPLRTPARIGLHRVIGRLSRELDAAQALMELLEVATRETSFPLRIPELLKQRLPAPPSGRRPHKRFTARLAVREPEREVPIKPRTVSGLVGALAEALDEQGTPTIVVSTTPAEVELWLSTQPAPGSEDLHVWGYGVVAPSSAALAAAAALASVVMEQRDGGTLLRIPIRG